MRLASLTVSGTMAVALWLLPAVAWAQFDAKFGPRGEITRLSAGGVVYFENISLSLIKPGWSGRLADQGAVDPRSVKVEKQNDSTVYTATLSAPGGTIRLREIARVAPRKVTLEYEVTPEQDVETEVVLLQGTMPADVHAGKTRYTVVGDEVARGVCPAELNRDGYVVFGGRSADWVGFTRRGEPALRVTPAPRACSFRTIANGTSPALPSWPWPAAAGCLPVRRSGSRSATRPIPPSRCRRTLPRGDGIASRA